MERWVLMCCLFLFSCGDDPSEKVRPATTADSVAQGSSYEPSAIDTVPTHVKDTSSHASYAPQVIKKPSGIYEFLLQEKGGRRILHTIEFKPGTYRLQEEYLGKKDSIIITEGTWAPSQGFIWLYKEQLARGRYLWKGDTLQYFDPKTAAKYSLDKLAPAGRNPAWIAKQKGGAILYGIGTEPFWSIEVNRHDSAVLSMPEWTSSLRVKLTSTNLERDSTVYVADSDSLRIVVYPYFCSDGMSDFTYSQKITVYYKGQVYNGCGVTF